MSKLPWCDQLAVILLIFEVLFLVFLGATSKDAGNPEQFVAAIGVFIRFPLFTILPIWIVLRLIDFMFAGPARRKHGAVIVRYPR